MYPLLKLALDLGPLLVFGMAYAAFGLLTATGALMGAVVVVAIIEILVVKKISPTLAFTAVLVLFLGGLTLGSSNEMFIKIKPTILYISFAAILLGGLAYRRLFIKLLLGQTLHLSDAAWRTLTWRMGVFFVVLAIANEIVWRNASTSMWVGFKIGLVPVTMIFMLAQAPFIARHQIEGEETPPAA
jgi:intracellular septation protein